MLVEEIQTALLNEHSEAIYRMIREHHPADIALALEELEDEEVLIDFVESGETSFENELIEKHKALKYDIEQKFSDIQAGN